MRKYSISATLDILERDLMHPMDRRILSLSVASGVTQADLDKALEGWDIEKSPIQVVLALSYLLKSRPDLVFPESMSPRLKGVITFCRFQNLKLSSHFNRIAKALNDAAIPFAILKGGAMKVYRPDYPRWMSDIDLLIEGDEDRFKKAESLIVSLGYEPYRDVHSTDMHVPGEENGVVDIHRYIHTGSERPYAISGDVLSRASLRPVFSAEALLPCPEDMVFISLANLSNNISEKTSHDSVINVFFDLGYLLNCRSSFDWDIVREDAQKSMASSRIRLMAMLLDRYIPGVIPEGFMSGEADKEELESLCFRVLYRRFVLSPRRLEIGEFDLRKAIRSCRPLPLYLVRRARYFFLKRFYSIPFLASSILDNSLKRLAAR